MRFVSKQVPFSAIQWSKADPLAHPLVTASKPPEGAAICYYIETNSVGLVPLEHGDWICVEDDGLIWVEDADNFAAQYESISDEKLKQRDRIAIGTKLPGLDGVFWRLLAVADPDDLPKWCRYERLLGTAPSTLFNAMSTWISSAVITVAGQVGPTQLRDAARGIMTNAAQIVESDVQELIKRKKTESIIRNDLKIVK